MEAFLGLVRLPSGDLAAIGATSSRDGDFAAPYGDGRASTDSLITRISPDGTLQDSFHSGGKGKDIWTDVALTKEGEIIVVGYTDSINGTLRPTCGSRDPVIAFVPSL